MQTSLDSYTYWGTMNKVTNTNCSKMPLKCGRFLTHFSETTAAERQTAVCSPTDFETWPHIILNYFTAKHTKTEFPMTKVHK